MLSEQGLFASKSGGYYKNKGRLDKKLYNLFRECVTGGDILAQRSIYRPSEINIWLSEKFYKFSEVCL